MRKVNMYWWYSVGANVEEAHGGVSDKDFQNKISISYKEA
jgi:four helix bundle protein